MRRACWCSRRSGAKAAAPPARASAPADDPFPVRIRRVRLQNAKLRFHRPQPAAAIRRQDLRTERRGQRACRPTGRSRSQIELDGRVDEFGLARIRGELNPFAPRNNTDVNVVFKNVDMVPASPYTMKFAGYKIAEGKISLDLQYKVRDGQLEGANQIVIDKLTLGERVDSPDALKLPLQLAIAILKDSDGRIDLGLPVSGNINDPQFSYGAIIWKAIGTLLTKIVTAPFRALGGLLGGQRREAGGHRFRSGQRPAAAAGARKVQAGGAAAGQAPAIETLGAGAVQRGGRWRGARARAVRVEIARRAGIRLEPGEEPGPADLGNRAVRSAVRELYAARFGDAELDKQKKAAGRPWRRRPAAQPARQRPKAEDGPGQIAAVAARRQNDPGRAAGGRRQRLLQPAAERLNQNQPLAADALPGWARSARTPSSPRSRKPASIRRAPLRRRPKRSRPMPASLCRSSWRWGPETGPVARVDSGAPMSA